jgi:phosphoribosylformylglycinamidine synthase
MVGADTVQRPGGDAAVVRVHGSKKALAITTDCTPRYCYADPYEGGKQAVAEAYRNLCAVGAKPLAITNCLNFGNPQRPEIMGQFVGCVEGMAEACRALDFPVVSGNVSLYNETKNEVGSSLAILPTPAIGGVGLLDDWEKTATIGFKDAGDFLFLIGDSEAPLGQAVWHDLAKGFRAGPPPKTDLNVEKVTGEVVRRLIAERLINAIHDCSDGGLAVAIAEMALASGLGAHVDVYGDVANSTLTEFMFGEAQARYVGAAPDSNRETVRDLVEGAGLMFSYIGEIEDTGNVWFGDLPGYSGHVATVSLADLRAAHEGFFPKLMGAELAPEF